MPEPLPGSAFEHKRARNDAVEIHYVVAGRGEAVVLLHGFPETWFGWRKKPVALASVRAKPPYLQYSNSPGRRDLSSRSQSPFSCSRLLIFPGYSAGIHCPNSSTTGNLSRISEPGSLFERRTLRISGEGPGLRGFGAGSSSTARPRESRRPRRIGGSARLASHPRCRAAGGSAGRWTTSTQIGRAHV